MPRAAGCAGGDVLAGNVDLEAIFENKRDAGRFDRHVIMHRDGLFGDRGVLRVLVLLNLEKLHGCRVPQCKHLDQHNARVAPAEDHPNDTVSCL